MVPDRVEEAAPAVVPQIINHARRPWYERSWVKLVRCFLSLLVSVGSMYTAVVALRETQRHNLEQSAIQYDAQVEPLLDKPVELDNRVPNRHLASSNQVSRLIKQPALARPDPTENVSPVPHLGAWVEINLVNKGFRTFSVSNIEALFTSCGQCGMVTVEEMTDAGGQKLVLPKAIEPGHELRVWAKLIWPSPGAATTEFFAQMGDHNPTLADYTAYLDRRAFAELSKQFVELLTPTDSTQIRTEATSNVYKNRSEQESAAVIKRTVKALFEVASSHDMDPAFLSKLMPRAKLGVEIKVAGLDVDIVREIWVPRAD